MDMAYIKKEELQKNDSQENYMVRKEKEYIHFYAGNVYWDDIWNDMQWIGSQAIDNGINGIVGRYKNQLHERNALSVINKADNTLENIVDLSEKDLQELLQAVADQINNKIQNSDELSKIIHDYQSLKNAMIGKINKFYSDKDQGEVDERTVRAIFNIISKTLDLLDSASKKEFDEFKATYLKQLKMEDRTKSKFYNPDDDGVVKITTKNPMLAQIEQTLNQIPKNLQNKMKSEGKVLSTSSLTASLSNTIMSRIIGEQTSAFLTNKVESTVQNAFVEVSGNVQVTGLSGKKINRKADYTTKNNYEILSSELCNFTANSRIRNNTDLIISLILDSSAKWYQEKNGQLVGEHITIHSTSGQTLAKLALDIFKKQAYGVYNTLVFYNKDNDKYLRSSQRKSRQQSFRILRSAVISNYLEKFLAGSGEKILGTNTTDTAVYLMVNGKFYSIMSILQVYLEDVCRLDGEGKQSRKYTYGSDRSNDLVFMNILNLNEKIKNDWKGKKRSKQAALLRSDATTRTLLLSFPVTFNLNKQILKRAIQVNNIKPV